MFKKVALLSTLMISYAHAMEEEKPLQPWVAEASTIAVHSALYKNKTIVPVDDTTTIGDVKLSLQGQEGIPVNQQYICALMRNWWTLGYTDLRTAPLSNDKNVKQIMSDNNTDRFQVLLAIRKDDV